MKARKVEGMCTLNIEMSLTLKGRKLRGEIKIPTMVAILLMIYTHN